MKICEIGESRIIVTPAEGDTSTTIADLAVFTAFDPEEASKYGTSIAAIAYEALEDEYGAFEKLAGGYTPTAGGYGAWMTFKDMSRIEILPE